MCFCVYVCLCVVCLSVYLSIYVLCVCNLHAALPTQAEASVNPKILDFALCRRRPLGRLAELYSRLLHGADLSPSDEFVSLILLSAAQRKSWQEHIRRWDTNVAPRGQQWSRSRVRAPAVYMFAKWHALGLRTLHLSIRTLSVFAWPVCFKVLPSCLTPICISWSAELPWRVAHVCNMAYSGLETTDLEYGEICFSALSRVSQLAATCAPTHNCPCCCIAAELLLYYCYIAVVSLLYCCCIAWRLKPVVLC